MSQKVTLSFKNGTFLNREIVVWGVLKISYIIMYFLFMFDRIYFLLKR